MGEHDLTETIRALLGAMKDGQTIINNNLDKIVGDHEKRIRYVEQWLWRGMGMAVIIAYVAGKVFK